MTSADSIRVAVVGPGAMGCLIAARMARSGVDTTLIDYRRDRTEALTQSGITVETPEGPFTARPKVALDYPQDLDLVIVVTKAYVTPDLQLPQDVPVLTLQNGLGNAETLAAKAGGGLVIAGSTREGATRKADGHVIHAGAGLTRLGPWTTCSTDLAARALSQAGFDVEVAHDVHALLWEKAIINAGINPVTAILGIPNGRVPQLSGARALMHGLVQEAVAVALAEGCDPGPDMVERTEQVCCQTATNISSMLQDVRAGRKTEIDAISGQIMTRAMDLDVPVPQTITVWRLVRCLETL